MARDNSEAASLAFPTRFEFLDLTTSTPATRSQTEKSRSWLAPASKVTCEKLAIQLATNNAECSNQSGAEHQQGARLWGGAAGAAKDLEGALARDAVIVPSVTTVVRGIKLAVGAITKVPNSHRRGGEACGRDDQPVGVSRVDGD